MTVSLGLTGGIASGKSTVTRMLASHGAAIIDADQLARDVVAVGSEALAEIADRFGRNVLKPDGSLDRRLLGQIVFANATKRQLLEKLLHPRIFAVMEERVGQLQCQEGVEVIVLDVPLLFETQQALRFCDCTVVVWVPKSVQIARLMQRDQLTRQEALQRIEAQMSLNDKCNLADFAIDNSGSIEETKRQVDQLWKQIALVS